MERRVRVRRGTHRFKPDPSRVLIRPFIPGDAERVGRVVQRVQALPDYEVSRQWKAVQRRFEGRHPDIRAVFERCFGQLPGPVFPPVEDLPEERRLLLGAYFTGEYAHQSAAVCNPSMVLHPDQGGLPDGALRFIVSLRAVGEGHVSSIEFRSGTISAQAEVLLDPVGKFVETPELIEEIEHDRDLLRQKMAELGHETPLTDEVLSQCDHRLSLADLERRVREHEERKGELTGAERRSADLLTWVARSRHELRFSPGLPLSERILFPVTADESHGIEDARFVRFVEEDGTPLYYATYSAYNGQVVLPQLLETQDFLGFKVTPLYGDAAKNKGMALFPRRVDGVYMAISRLDGENLYLTVTDNVYIWNEALPLLGPAQPWELIQMGNCGSPIETEAGWLLLTHGVGPMRRYCIGAVLLDHKDPSRIIGRLRDPLMEPQENEREGYVPNVVYTCGGLVHDSLLVLPYGMADYASGIAFVELQDLLAHME